MDTAEIEWTSRPLTNEIRLKLASGFETNHKTKDSPQTLLSFVRKIPNHNEAKWTLPVFEIVQGKSSPK